MAMKIFTATIVSNNGCYLHTLLVVAEDKKKAHDQLCEQQKRKVKYTEQLKEVDIDLNKPTVIEYVGWGHTSSDYGSDD